MGVLSFKLRLSDLHEQVVVNVVVAVDSGLLRVLLKDLVTVTGTIHLHLLHLLSKLLLGSCCCDSSNTVVGLRKLRLSFSQFRVIDQTCGLAVPIDSQIQRIFCLLHHLLRVSLTLSILVYQTRACELYLKGLAIDAKIHPISSRTPITALAVTAAQMTLLN